MKKSSLATACYQDEVQRRGTTSSEHHLLLILPHATAAAADTDAYLLSVI